MQTKRLFDEAFGIQSGRALFCALKIWAEKVMGDGFEHFPDFVMSDRNRVAAQVLDAWGTAIRGDWSNIDGRSCRAQLAEVSAYLRGQRETLTIRDVDVCECTEDKWVMGYHWMTRDCSDA